MKILTLLTAMLALPLIHEAQTPYRWLNQRSADGKYTYKIVENDPMKVRFYTLKNGLTVIMSVNKNAPRVQTFIATKAGSKNDPADHTGLAHYLEHMLFKGTDKYGTKDFAKEKVYLDKIDGLYELYNHTEDEAKRKEIYKEIDSVSGLAAKYAIANEYDKLMQGIGAKGTNAFTSTEETVYVNDIPQNQVSKWLLIEAERFRNPVMRLFHTELEAVYEEKNISLDRDGEKVEEKILAALFTKHTYGTQTTIGTVEHLKNPSLDKIRNYYNTWYVPNNMAIILCGDIAPDQLIKEIDKAFGYMKPKPVPAFTFQPEPVHSSPQEFTVFGPEAENVNIAFRLPGATTREAKIAELADKILMNSRAGLIDLNLIKKQKVLRASSSIDQMKDYGVHYLSGVPKSGQTLDEIRDLLMQQIELLKKGSFDNALLPAIIANMKVRKVQEMEENQGRAFNLLDAFVSGDNWKDRVAEIEEMQKITKEEVMKFARKYYTNDYVVVYKKTGKDNHVVKVQKPHITPVEVNRADRSPFVVKITGLAAENVKPVFLDYGKDIAVFKTSSNLPVYSLQNKDNGLFNISYVFDMGKNNDLKLPMAVNLLQYLGTDKYTPDQVSQEFYKLACNFSINPADDRTTLTITGLQENFGAALSLFEELLTNAKPDQAALNELVQQTLKGREDNKLNKNIILRVAMNNYAMYGPENPFTHCLSTEELKALKADELVNNYIHNLTAFQHKVFYYGPQTKDELTASISNYHKVPATLKPYPKAVKFTRQDNKENLVYFTNYDMVQAEILWINKSGAFNAATQPSIALFNEYFGAGMSSIVFQTIRESKALAYSSSSRYLTPQKLADPYYITAYIGTQADKLNDAIPAMNELLNNMPRADKSFEDARVSLRNQIETERITKMGVLMNYDNALKLGLDHDIRKDVYAGLEKMSLCR
jgi:predicted Zn-dependent peptidase